MIWPWNGACRPRIRAGTTGIFVAFARPRPYIGTMDDGTRTTMTIDEIRDNFELLEEWDDRYRYVIELGRMLKPLPEEQHSPENKVQGCVSQVWLSKQVDRESGGEP